MKSQLRVPPVVAIEAWYADGNTAVITANTRRTALNTALETVGLIAVFPHPTQHPEPCHKPSSTNEQEKV